MGVQAYTIADITSPIRPTRLFKAYVTDVHNFMPKVVPHFIKSIELVQGHSSSPVGNIKQVNLGEGVPFKYVKNRVDELDCDKFYYKFTTFEGDALGDNLEQVVYEYHFEPLDTGCQIKMIAHYHTKGDNVMKEEEIDFAKVSTNMIYDIVENHLISNPEVYA